MVFIKLHLIVVLHNYYQLMLSPPKQLSYKHFNTIFITLSLYGQVSLQLEIISQVSCDPVIVQVTKLQVSIIIIKY